jgi:hypothetical protein
VATKKTQEKFKSVGVANARNAKESVTRTKTAKKKEKEKQQKGVFI